MIRSNRIKGFTLKELVVVLASVALLTAVLIPTLTHATVMYRSVSCMSRMAQIATALSMYSDDNSGYVPGTYPYGPVADSGGSGITWPSWMNLLVTLSDEAWLTDPDYNSSGTPWGPPVDYLDSPELIQCPQDATDLNQYAQAVNGSYGINDHMINGYSPGASSDGRFYNLQMTIVPAQMYLVFCNLNDGGGEYHDQTYASVRNFIDFTTDPIRAWTPALRHPYGQATHVMYHDGSVGSLDWQDIRTAEGSAVNFGSGGEPEWRIKGPWMNGEGLTERHDIPASELPTIMSLPGHGQVTKALPGDFSEDGTVDIVDLNMVLIDWGNTGLDVIDQRADTNSDDTVDLIDLNTVLIDWGKTSN